MDGFRVDYAEQRAEHKGGRRANGGAAGEGKEMFPRWQRLLLACRLYRQLTDKKTRTSRFSMGATKTDRITKEWNNARVNGGTVVLLDPRCWVWIHQDNPLRSEPHRDPQCLIRPRLSLSEFSQIKVPTAEKETNITNWIVFCFFSFKE